ncbi:ActS/PrrB/RegB family redox-sensitive histidine kinase [Pelagibacteraceae bacterium]|nr:ActS/PrrB/RegB family redox-sensitive histidine kinase [Pelagibacteraceae bacterium]|tara:strand:+ start:17 stop:1300 length:1284 start_codon:yes stop_codon:yes gene_type:complete
MNLSTLFRLEENLHLDKKTLVDLRWIAIIGQLIAVNFVYFFLNLDLPIIETHIIISIGFITNIVLQFKIKTNQLKDLNSALFLVYDLLQLSILLYLTGGIFNPFSLLIIVPTIVSSTFLSMGTTIILGTLTISLLFFLKEKHMTLPGLDLYNFSFPEYYVAGALASIIIGLVFLSYFGIKFSGETKKRSEALDKLQKVMAKEYELDSLGGLAAAAAHSLGTPLATISVVAKELKKEIGDRSKYSKDLDLLTSQAKRCSEILKRISKKEIRDDQFINLVKVEDLLEEIIISFEKTSEKRITLSESGDKNKINIKRSPEIVYGLRNFIGNAIKFADEEVVIKLISDDKNLVLLINDDGPGYSEDIIKFIGEPYLKSKSKKISSKAGLGLGIFLGKTLLERKKAQLTFSNNEDLKGALVKITWNILDIKN